MRYRSMHIRIGVLPLLFVLAVAAQQQALSGQSSETHHQPITEDLSAGARFTFKIAANLPEFTFKVIPEVRKTDPYGNPQSIIEDVQVFPGASNKPSQSLADCDWVSMEAPYRDSNWLRVADMNFDGYADIFVLTNWGATGNQSGCVWLFHPDSGRYEFSAEFSELGTYTLDPATKTITTHGNSSVDTFSTSKYTVVNNRPVLAFTAAHDFDSDRQEYHCVIQKRREREGDFVTIREVWAKDSDEACDPSDPFKEVERK